MPTTTPNIGLTKPVVGADADAWGGQLNSSLDVIDGIFVAGGTGTSVGINIAAGKTLRVNNGTVNIDGTTGSAIDGCIIGGSDPKAATVTTLTATNASVTGGTLTLTPTTAGAINNVNIGASTPGTGAFTTLSATGAATLNGAGNKLTVSGTGSTFVASPASAGTLDNVAIGATTPAAVTGTVVRGNVAQEAYLALSGTSIDVQAAALHTKTITVPTTLSVTNMPAAGVVCSFILELTNPNGNVTFWSGISGPTYTQSPTGTDILGFYTRDGGSTWRRLILAQAL